MGSRRKPRKPLPPKFDGKGARPFKDYIDLWPGQRAELAQHLGRTRMALWLLEHKRFNRPPLRFLLELQAELQDTGLIDGSTPPTFLELMQSYQAIPVRDAATIKPRPATRGPRGPRKPKPDPIPQETP